MDKICFKCDKFEGFNKCIYEANIVKATECVSPYVLEADKCRLCVNNEYRNEDKCVKCGDNCKKCTTLKCY